MTTRRVRPETRSHERTTIPRERPPLHRDRIEVEAGFMKIKLPQGVPCKAGPELHPVHQEINVIGQRAEEARDAVDGFLDRAVTATAGRVRIVNGFGMGVLRKMVQELLSKHPHVARYYPARPQEWGGGATIVELRE